MWTMFEQTRHMLNYTFKTPLQLVKSCQPFTTLPVVLSGCTRAWAAHPPLPVPHAKGLEAPSGAGGQPQAATQLEVGAGHVGAGG